MKVDQAKNPQDSVEVPLSDDSDAQWLSLPLHSVC